MSSVTKIGPDRYTLVDANGRKPARQEQGYWTSRFESRMSNEENLALFYPLEVTDYMYLRHMPRWSYAANEDKKIFWLPQHEYIDAHYYSPQPYRSKKVAIILDIDSSLDVATMREMGIPMPRTFTGRPPHNASDHYSCRPHLVYWLNRPVWGNSRNDMALYNDVCGRLANLLGRLCYVERINPPTTKNPAKRVYGTEDPFYHVIEGDLREWGLEELSEAIDNCEAALAAAEVRSKSITKAINKTVYTDTRKWVEEPNQFPCINRVPKMHRIPKLHQVIGRRFRQHVANKGRHEGLFEHIRFVAYAYKPLAESEEDLHKYVLRQCEIYNDKVFAKDPLPESSIHSTARSISSWTWRYYRYSGREQKDRGVCRRLKLIHGDMSTTERQAIGGKYGAQQNAAKKKLLVINAVEELRASRKDVVISSLARDLRMSRDTVRKYVAEARTDTLQDAEAPQNLRITVPSAPTPELSSDVTKTVPIRRKQLLLAEGTERSVLDPMDPASWIPALFDEIFPDAITGPVTTDDINAVKRSDNGPGSAKILSYA
ncbi:primase C-terminal domain-containing protein [Sulfitobacter sp. 15WGC]|uniref:primase C-terminal domain-containing protein n=1 Tax=Sulfitobacter sp. 15WGC TaxID=2575437 RepID=UPI00200B35A1|nr:primase C-terminal domain-containing protein [Sulfitobacter sp. 15WGC]